MKQLERAGWERLVRPCTISTQKKLGQATKRGKSAPESTCSCCGKSTPRRSRAHSWEKALIHTRTLRLPGSKGQPQNLTLNNYTEQLGLNMPSGHKSSPTYNACLRSVRAHRTVCISLCCSQLPPFPLSCHLSFSPGFLNLCFHLPPLKYLHVPERTLQVLWKLIN